MKNIYKNIVIVTLILVIVLTFPILCISAKTTKSKVTAEDLASGKQYTLSNMPYSGKYSILKTYNGKPVTPGQVQNFAFTPDGKYIFTTSIGKIEGKEHPVLTRNERTAAGINAKAECKQAMVLYGYAHPEVLCITQPDTTKEVYDIWVASNPGKNYMGREITRLTYSVGKNGTDSIIKRVSIYGFKKANVVNGKSTTFKGKKAPISVGASIDTGSNQIMFRLRMPSGYGVVYVSYNFEKINSALDGLPNNGRYKITKAKNWQRAIVRCGIRPNDTLQSWEVLGKKIYLCGGHFNKGAGIYVIPFKTQKQGKAREQIKGEKQLKQSIEIVPELTIDGKTYGKDKIEIEGMKVFHNGNKTDYYVSFITIGSGLRETIGIYKFTR